MLKTIKNFQNHQGFMKYFKNTSWLFFEKMFRMLISLFVGIWVARYLGPEQFGLFSYAQSFVGLFATISTLGLDGIVVREFLNNKKNEYELIGTTFFLKLLGAMLVLFILSVAINFTSNDINTNILVFIIASSMIFQSFNVVDFYFQSKVLSKYVVYANVISLFISSLIKIVLIVNNAPLIFFAWIILFDSVILAFGYIAFYVKINSMAFIKKIKFSKALAVSLLKDSWPLILSGIAISFYMKIDQIMIKEMLDSNSVGQYAAAIRLSEAWYFIPMVICSSLFPAIINAKNTNKELYYNRLQKLYDFMVLLSLLIIVPTLFLSNYIIELLYGHAYLQSGKVLALHIVGSVFVFLGVASGKWFIAENLQKYSFYRTFTGSIVNIILNYILIPLYGIYGAAIATIISQFIASYLFNATSKRLRYTFVLQTNAILLPVRKLGIKFE